MRTLSTWTQGVGGHPALNTWAFLALPIRLSVPLPNVMPGARGATNVQRTLMTFSTQREPQKTRPIGIVLVGEI